MQTIIDIPAKVRIPTSELGKGGKVGTVLSVWRNKIAVDFGGRLGHYTITKHVIEDATNVHC